MFRFCLENWEKVAEFVGGGRMRAQCSQRWNRALNPRLFSGVWTPEEDWLLLAYVAMYGEKCWTTISRGMKRRSDVQCRYQFRALKRNPEFAEQWKMLQTTVRVNPGIAGPPLIPITPSRAQVRAALRNLQRPEVDHMSSSIGSPVDVRDFFDDIDREVPDFDTGF
jgi:hypothetical protein